MGRLTRPLFAFAAIIVIVAGLRLGREVLAPVLFALVVVILVAPIVQRLRGLGMPSWLALTLTIVGVLLVGSLVIILFYGSISQILRRLPEYQAQFIAQINPIITLLEERGINAQEIIGTAVPTSSSIARTALSISLDVLGNVFGIVFFVVLVVLMLAESERFGRRLRDAAPENPLIGRLDRFTGQIQRQYAIQAGSNLVSAVAITVMLLIFGVDYAVLWGVLVFFLAFVPNVGLSIAVVPAVVLAFVQHGPLVAGLVILATVAINLVMDNVVTPRFLGAGLNLPVLVVFLSLFFWTWVFGLLGALLAVPATLFLRLLLENDERTRPIAMLLVGDVEEKG